MLASGWRAAAILLPVDERRRAHGLWTRGSANNVWTLNPARTSCVCAGCFAIPVKSGRLVAAALAKGASDTALNCAPTTACFPALPVHLTYCHGGYLFLVQLAAAAQPGGNENDHGSRDRMRGRYRVPKARGRGCRGQAPHRTDGCMGAPTRAGGQVPRVRLRRAPSQLPQAAATREIRACRSH